MNPDINHLLKAVPIALLASALLVGCNSSSNNNKSEPKTEPEITRLHDERKFQVVSSTLAFAAPSGANAPVLGAKRYWGTYDGIQGQAGYRIEIPANWDGGLIMWTRGYGGEGNLLTGLNITPSVGFRNAALEAGYAWAASTYSANFYDVRAAIEDTNKLALEIKDYLADQHEVEIQAPTRLLIAGLSMGGHTAAAAVEAETIERARYRVEYEGAMPVCQAEQNQFTWLGDYTRVAQQLAGYGHLPSSDFTYLRPLIEEALFESTQGTDAYRTTAQGDKLKDIAMILTGGPRPVFAEGFRVASWQEAVLGTGGRDGTINGILARESYDNTDRIYRWTTDAQPTNAELAFNASIRRTTADEDANPVRNDGVRWLPEVHGNFNVPVLTMHTLGDFYVPFRHQQLYREGAKAHGNDHLLVQRAIRDPGHCGFTADEYYEATSDFLNWVDNSTEPPAGDEVLDPEVVADPAYGCQFTSVDRPGLAPCPAT